MSNQPETCPHGGNLASDHFLPFIWLFSMTQGREQPQACTSWLLHIHQYGPTVQARDNSSLPWPQSLDQKVPMQPHQD